MQLKSVPFLHVTHSLSPYDRLTEQKLSDPFWARYCHVVYVDNCDLKHKPDFRLMGECPALAHNMTEADMKKFTGFPRFCFGLYYDPKSLLLMDDVIEWSHHHLSFDQIRTAEDIIQENIKKS